MKLLAHSYVWWLNIHSDIEKTVSMGNSCQVNVKSTPAVEMHPWEYQQGPWKHIQFNYASLFMNKIYLIAVVIFSKWINIHVVTTATSQATIEQLETTFATHSVPTTIVSDNGSFLLVASLKH